MHSTTGGLRGTLEFLRCARVGVDEVASAGFGNMMNLNRWHEACNKRDVFITVRRIRSKRRIVLNMKAQ